jgi:alkylated DNA repair protein (DNA oxidative demethylase)
MREHRERKQQVLYEAGYLSDRERSEIIAWLETLKPIWENRYSESNPPHPGDHQRQLLRPVYWLGNWQFACLDYYHPPEGIENRCVKAESFPRVLQDVVDRIERKVAQNYSGGDLPARWKLNTCLVNFYGARIEGDKETDCARVGEHKDFEPGPVASLSLGERALFQFVESDRRGTRGAVILQQWLEDRSLQIFGGEKWKRRLFHRVQRVEDKMGVEIGPKIEGFRTRRINFTFRYVPEPHIKSYHEFPAHLKRDVLPYMKQLAESSPYFARELESGVS